MILLDNLPKDWRAAQIIRGSCVEHSIPDQPNSSQVEHSSCQETVGKNHKCNIDASFSSPFDKASLEMCIRDDVRDFVLVKTAWFSLLCDVDV